MAVSLGMGATIGSALLFQHVGGYMPCALCLEQRTAYYIGLPVGLIAIGAVLAGAPAWLGRIALLIIGLLMLWTMAIGVYHAGVEWNFWAGPADCAAGATANFSGDLLSALDAVVPPSCTEAALRVGGISMAGWNVIAAAILAALALYGAYPASSSVSQYR
ncbi:disulfide bond formation protein B [Aureimonas fodinaquatilis]|uniref:Disulfide bond formation protein B n=2 Tax=Aureimonas fodinaquatilis TaxID=2565783 RepID=A0A5B0E1D2_9HYPH|nr:disulfide bond formation protein B [Aureimonas fodinaquatilis]